MPTITVPNSQVPSGQPAEVAEQKSISLGKGIAIILLCGILFAAIGIGVGEMFFWHRYSTATEAEHLLQANLQAVQTDPNNPLYHINLGLSYADLGQSDQAIGQFKQALTLDPQSYGAIYNLGFQYLLQKNYDQAAPLFKKAIQLVPDNAMPHLDLAICYYYTNQLDSATSELNLALKYNPGTPNVAYWQGMVLEKQKKFQDAVAQFQTALDLNPNYAEAKAELNKLNKLGYK